jgi:hypothetical protein
MNKYGKIFTAAAVLLCLLASTGALAADPSQAQPSPPPRKIVFLQLPLDFQGDFKPMERDEILKFLEKDVENLAPAVDLVVPDLNDPRLKDLPPDGHPSNAEALKLSQSFKADLVCWGSISFALRRTVVQAGAGSPVFQYLISVEGTADVQVYDPASNDIVVDQAIFQGNNGVTRALEGSETYLALQKKLATECVQDISFALIRALKDRLTRLEQTH